MGFTILLCQKKDGKLCSVQDYCQLNALTKKNWTPLPLITETIDQLKEQSTSQRWMYSGFNNVQIAEGDKRRLCLLPKEGYLNLLSCSLD